jgi:hypothetical protein
MIPTFLQPLWGSASHGPCPSVRHRVRVPRDHPSTHGDRDAERERHQIAVPDARALRFLQRTTEQLICTGNWLKYVVNDVQTTHRERERGSKPCGIEMHKHSELLNGQQGCFLSASLWYIRSLILRFPKRLRFDMFLFWTKLLIHFSWCPSLVSMVSVWLWHHLLFGSIIATNRPRLWDFNIYI